MVGHAEAEARQAGAGEIADAAALRQRQDQGERTRPERLRESFGDPREHALAPGLGHVGDMGDQRIEAWAALGRVNPRHGARIDGVGAEAIDGFGGKGDEAAGAQDFRSRRQALGVGGQPSGHAVFDLCHGTPIDSA
jgi:hypothetical protein